MMIKLQCKSCLYKYEVTEAEIKDNGELHRYCLNCGGEMKVTNLDEIVKKDLETQVKENLKKWFNQYGIEFTIEFVERNNIPAVRRLYIEELRRMRLIK